MSRPSDLENEIHTGVLAISSRHLAKMEKLGCKASAIAALGAKQAPFGVLRCDMRGRRFFEPTSEKYGIDVVLMPVTQDRVVIDLIAWRTLAPDVWLWRNGDGWALGIDQITQPSPWDGFREITLHATPLDWLRVGGEGAVILDWSAVSHIRKLALFDTLKCDHPTVQKRLSDILSTPERKPKIIGAGAKNERAA